MTDGSPLTVNTLQHCSCRIATTITVTDGSPLTVNTLQHCSTQLGASTCLQTATVPLSWHEAAE